MSRQNEAAADPPDAGTSGMDEASSRDHSTPTNAPGALATDSVIPVKSPPEREEPTRTSSAPAGLGPHSRVTFSHQMGRGGVKERNLGSHSESISQNAEDGSGKEGERLDKGRKDQPWLGRTDQNLELSEPPPPGTRLTPASLSSRDISGTIVDSSLHAPGDVESMRSTSPTPCHDQTEMLAVAVLVDDEETMTQSLPQPIPPPESAVAIQVARAEPVPAENEDHDAVGKLHCRPVHYLLGFVVIALLLGMSGLILGLLLGKTSGTAPASSEFSIESFVEFEIPAYSREALLADNGSPQAKAIAFLKQDPQISSYTASRRLTRFSLGVFFFSLLSEIQESQWINMTGWGTNASECSWYTTNSSWYPTHLEPTCNSSGSFVTLNLQRNQLLGTVPTEIELLTDLHRIELIGNAIRGTIPVELGNLKSLSYLDLSINELVGTVPATLGNISALQFLAFVGNILTGTVPELLFGGSGHRHNSSRSRLLGGSDRRSLQQDESEWTSLLEYAYFDQNTLTGTIPTTIGNARHLKNLSFHGNYLEGTVPESISNLASLYYFGTIPCSSAPGRMRPHSLPLFSTMHTRLLPTFVDVRSNFVAGRLNWTLSLVPPSIGWLDFGQNMFSGTIPHEIGRRTNLTFLGLDANNLEGTLPTEIGLLTKLTVLYLDNTRLSGTIPTELYVYENIIVNFGKVSWRF
jgi:hypothetical protein